MEFYTACKEKRPVRLSEKTRDFAYRSLEEHEYGLDTRRVGYIDVEIPDIENVSKFDIYDAQIAAIAENAPIRICDGELISGAATLGNAINHQIPARVNGGNMYASVSHLTLDFPKLLRVGVNGIEKEVHESIKKYAGDEYKQRLLQSYLNVIGSMRVWHKRYIDALTEKGGYEKTVKNLQRVPFDTPTSFHEAVQSVWFMFAFERLCGNWPGIGRIDWMLEPYLKNDLEKGILTLDEAREILAHFFIKGCEWVTGGNYGSGDAQHYQNLVLSGIDPDGNDVTGYVTYLVLDILEEFNIGDFPTTVRLNKNTDEKLLRRLAEVIRHGGGAIALYDEDTILRAMMKFGYEEREARQFANDGCWEVQVPGKTWFSYSPFDALGVLQCRTLKKYAEGTDYATFEDLYAQFLVDLRAQIEESIMGYIDSLFDKNEDGSRTWIRHTVASLIDILEEGCIDKGVQYFFGGPRYNVLSPHIGGAPDVANSLYAIKKLVYEEKKLTLPELMDVLRNNWEGNEPLRQYVRTHYTYFGNDNDEVDAIAARILHDFSCICLENSKRYDMKTPAGVSTFGRQIDWSPTRMATPHGYKDHDILAGNFSPTPGTDVEGATAIIRSYCKADMTEMTTGAALDIKLLPSCVEGEDGVTALAGLMRGFVTLGGCFMQIDVIDNEVLKAAQEHPEDYQTLSVRVSGWNARFVTLNKQWQDMIINREAQDKI